MVKLGELLRKERITDLVGRFQRRPLTKRRRVAIKDTRLLHDELDVVSAKLERVLDLYSRGKLDEVTLEGLSRRLRRRQEALREQLDTLEGPLEVDFHVNRERLEAFLGDMERWIREGDIVRRKTLLRKVYREIRLWPKMGRKPCTRKVLAQPTWRRLHALSWCPRRDSKAGSRFPHL